jgi:hypothetical protein
LKDFTSNDYFPSIRIIFYILAPLGLDRAVLTFIIRKKSRLITDVRIRTGLISYAVGSSPEKKALQKWLMPKNLHFTCHF